jgi:hypothetical protein
MPEPEKRLLLALLGCVSFGYAIASCLLFYRRTRLRAAQYTNQPLEGFVRSPLYNMTLWITGVVGIAGFVISSWQLVMSLLAILGGGQ